MKKIQFKLTWLSVLVLIAVSVFVTSCEQEALTPDDVLTTIDEEGFRSTTGNADLPAEDDDAIGTVQAVPVLHMNFKSDVSKEEREAQWAAAVEEYMNTAVESRHTTAFVFEISTRTGSQTANGTDGRVEARVIFDTNRVANINTGFFLLDNPGNDREQGDIDTYLFEVFAVNPAVECVGIQSASIRLRGRDGWFVTDFDVCMRGNEQPLSVHGTPAVGNSFLFSDPDQWLDNNVNNSWDTFNTGNIGFGDVCW